MHNNSNLINKIERLTLILSIIGFIAISFKAIDMVEIDHSDEVFHGICILKFVKNAPTYVNFLGRYFPVITDGKHGAMEIYLLSPFMCLGRTSLYALRLGYVFWGVALLMLSYYFASRLFNSTVGVLSIILLVTNVSFWNIFKFGGFFPYSLSLFTLSALLFFLKWHRSGKNIYFYLGMFLLGLGYQTKGWFIWFIIALFITGLALYLSEKKITFKIILIGVVFMFIALLPILYYYLKSDFYNGFMLKNFIFTEAAGVNNMEISKNLCSRIKNLNSLLISRVRLHNVFEIFQIYFFWFSIGYLFYKVYIKKKMILLKKRISFVLLLSSITFIVSIFTFTGHYDGHMFILFPYVQILMSAAVFEMFGISKYKLWKIGIFLLIIILAAGNIVRCAETYCDLKKYKESRSHCEISALTSWLLENKGYNPVTFNSLVTYGIQFYSDLKIQPMHLPYSENKDNVSADFQFISKLENVIKNSGKYNIFIFEFIDSLEHKTFKLLCNELNKKIIIRKEYLWSDGSTRFIVYSLN